MALQCVAHNVVKWPCKMCVLCLVVHCGFCKLRLVFHGVEVKAQEKLRFVWTEESWCILAFCLQRRMSAFRTHVCFYADTPSNFKPSGSVQYGHHGFTESKSRAFTHILLLTEANLTSQVHAGVLLRIYDIQLWSCPMENEMKMKDANNNLCVWVCVRV